MVNNFRYKEIFYDNLKISWFISDRKAPPVPFERVILNYAKLTPEARRAPENYILERFTLEEMDLLRQYLMTQNIRPMTEECKLPVTEKDRGYRDLQNMIGAEYLPLYTRNGYNLPFRTEGFFNVKTADERIEGDDERPTVISRVNFEEIRRLAKS